MSFFAPFQLFVDFYLFGFYLGSCAEPVLETTGSGWSCVRSQKNVIHYDSILIKLRWMCVE